MIKIALFALQETISTTKVAEQIANYLSSDGELEVAVIEANSLERYRLIQGEVDEDNAIVVNNVTYVPEDIYIDELGFDVVIYDYGSVNVLFTITENFDKVYLCENSDVSNISAINDYFSENQFPCDILLFEANQEELKQYSSTGYKCIKSSETDNNICSYEVAMQLELLLARASLTAPAYDKNYNPSELIFEEKKETEENNKKHFFKKTQKTDTQATKKKEKRKKKHLKQKDIDNKNVDNNSFDEQNNITPNQEDAFNELPPVEDLSTKDEVIIPDNKTTQDNILKNDRSTEEDYNSKTLSFIDRVALDTQREEEERARLKLETLQNSEEPVDDEEIKKVITDINYQKVPKPQFVEISKEEEKKQLEIENKLRDIEKKDRELKNRAEEEKQKAEKEKQKYQEELSLKDKQIEKATQELEEFNNNVIEKENALKEAKRISEQKDQEIIKKQEALDKARDIAKQKEDEITQKEEELQNLREHSKQKDSEITKKEEELNKIRAAAKEKDQEIVKKEEALNKVKEIAKQKDAEVAQKELELNQTKDLAKQKEQELDETKNLAKQKEEELNKAIQFAKEKENEITKKNEALQEAKSNILSQNKELEAKENRIKELEYRATHDKLTNAKNRTAFDKDIKKYQVYSIIFFDINNLKQTNDTFGHQYGDKLIITIVNTINSVFPDDELYRLGGDEFVVITKDIDDKIINKSLSLLEKQLDDISKKDGQISYEVAFGFASSIEGNQSDILSLADKRMYANKKEKKHIDANKTKENPIFDNNVTHIDDKQSTQNNQNDTKEEIINKVPNFNQTEEYEEKLIRRSDHTQRKPVAITPTKKEKTSKLSSLLKGSMGLSSIKERANNLFSKNNNVEFTGNISIFVTSLRHGCGASYIAGSLASSLTDVYDRDIWIDHKPGDILPDNIMVKEINNEKDLFEAYRNGIVVFDKGLYDELSEKDVIEMNKSNVHIIVCTADDVDLKKLANFIRNNKSTADEWLYVFNHVHDNQVKKINLAMKDYNHLIIPFHDYSEVPEDIREEWREAIEYCITT